MEQKSCPFNDPNFNIGPFDPCPICGVKGWVEPEEIDEKCVEGLLGDKKHVLQSS